MSASAQEADGAESSAMAVGLLGAAVCGFMRSMPLEAPPLKTQVLDLSGTQEMALGLRLGVWVVCLFFLGVNFGSFENMFVGVGAFGNIFRTLKGLKQEKTGVVGSQLLGESSAGRTQAQLFRLICGQLGPEVV